MTEYLKKSFTVAMPTGEAYRDNWEAIFAKKPDPCALGQHKWSTWHGPEQCEVCDVLAKTLLCPEAPETD